MTEVNAQPKTLLLLPVGMVSVWSLSWSITKPTLQELPPLWLVALRFGIACLVVFVLLSIPKRYFFSTRQDIPLLTVSLVQIVAFSLLITRGLKHAEVRGSAILAYPTSLWVISIIVLLVLAGLTCIALTKRQCNRQTNNLLPST